MIKNIIYVEDGSIDEDSLSAELGDDTRIIVYRQGSIPPKVEQLDRPIENSWDSENQKMQYAVKMLLNDIFKSKTTPKNIKNKAGEIHTNYFD